MPSVPRMRIPRVLLAWLCVVASVAAAEVPTSNVIYRVLRLKTAASTGSAFTIEVEGRQYLITARHNLKGFGDEGEIDLWIEGRWSRVRARAIYPAKEIVDVAALDLGRPITITLPLEPTSGGLTLGQQVYFLGYPYGLSTAGFVPVPPGFGEIPFLKSGIVSAIDSRDPEANVLYLDGQNNPGFSGGPIVFWHAESRRFRVAGVVRGYRNEALPVLKRKNLDDPAAPAYNDLYTRANSGIVVGYDIRHIVAAIRAASRASAMPIEAGRVAPPTHRPDPPLP
jgi:trypsin-like peptidase